MSRSLQLDEIQNRLNEKYNGRIVIDGSTYINTRSLCRFIDVEYGEWWTCANNVINKGHEHKLRGLEKQRQTMYDLYGTFSTNQLDSVKEKQRNSMYRKYGVYNAAQSKLIYEKIKQTNIKKYGSENVQQNREIRMKSIKKLNFTYLLYHWKTNEEIICQGSWERAVVEYFNKHKIDFNTQILFSMPNGKKYFCDFYIIEKNMYVEVKGRFIDDAKEKWEWFHRENPNSELWNKKKLKEMGIDVK